MSVKMLNIFSHPVNHVSSTHEVTTSAFVSRLCIVIGSVLFVTHFHYATATQYEHFHDIFRRLYYLPIILGGIWFRTRGGVVTAILVSIMYAPHIIFQWGAYASEHIEQYLEVFLYNIIGLLTGLLSDKEWQRRQQLEKTAADLKHSYAHLKEQAEIILEFEEQMVKASRLSTLGELSASLAHEIRNPLGSIRGTAEILSDAVQTNHNRAEFAKILIKETDRLNEVLENFLRFACTSPAENKRFDLHETLEELLTFTRQECDRLNLAITINKGALPTIPGDKSQLKQVFLNFILNAAQAMESGGHLDIKTSRSGNSVMICFKDDGPGISAANISKIFDPFFTTKTDGVGLGLAITHRIVKAHGGRIEVKSQEGAGTTFSLLLPIYDT